MEEISILQAVINGGPSLILAVGLIWVWRTWRAERREFVDEIVGIRQTLEETQEKRVEDAAHWAGKLCESAKRTAQAISELEKILETTERMIGRPGR